MNVITIWFCQSGAMAESAASSSQPVVGERPELPPGAQPAEGWTLGGVVIEPDDSFEDQREQYFLAHVAVHCALGLWPEDICPR